MSRCRLSSARKHRHGGLPRFKERGLVCRLTRSSVCPAMYKRLAIVRLPIFLFSHASYFAVAAAFADSLRFLLPPGIFFC